MPSAQSSTSEVTPRVALVTGAARRIGREIALGLARDGWAVGVHYRNSREDAETLAAEIAKTGSHAVALQCDLADTRALARLVADCANALGAPECLINNASEFLDDSIETLDEQSWNLHLDTNLKAPVFLAQAMLKALAPGRTGNIVNIIDQRVLKLSPDFFSYTIAKSGLWTATQTLAQALSPRIRVNAIAPGPVFRSVHQTEAGFAAEQAATLLGKGPGPQELAGTVRFILETPSMTGTMIAIDAGQHLV